MITNKRPIKKILGANNIHAEVIKNNNFDF